MFTFPKSICLCNDLGISVLCTTLETHLVALLIDPVSGYFTAVYTAPALEDLRIAYIIL